MSIPTPPIRPVATAGPWHEDAACRHADSDLFFGPHRERPGARHRREAAARKVCLHCPVQRVCAASALVGLERNGMWGGLGENDRAALWVHLGITVPGVTETAVTLPAAVLHEQAERAAWLATGDGDAVADLMATGTAEEGRQALDHLLERQRSVVLPVG